MFVGVSVSKKYEGEDGKLMPASTPEGLRARIIIAPMMLIGAAALIVNYTHPEPYMKSAVWVIASLVGIGIPIFNYIKFRKKQTPRTDHIKDREVHKKQ
jgi:hypothetical protein